jgi:hypothetical protein
LQASILPKCPAKGIFYGQKTNTHDQPDLNIYMDTNINVTDLVALRNIINLAAERGAFKAEEMLEVGTVYTKLSNFLEAVITQAQTQEQTADDAETPQGE